MDPWIIRGPGNGLTPDEGWGGIIRLFTVTGFAPRSTSSGHDRLTVLYGGENWTPAGFPRVLIRFSLHVDLSDLLIACATVPYTRYLD